MRRFGTGSADYRLWNVRFSRVVGPTQEPEWLGDSKRPPTTRELTEWRGVAENEGAPDRFRAICAMALLYDGQRQYGTTEEVAEVLGWDLERTKTALEAAVEAGNTTHWEGEVE